MTDDTAALARIDRHLAELGDAIEALRDDTGELRELIAGRRLSASERAAFARVLPAIHRATHGELFASADIVEYQKRGNDAAALRETFGKLTAKQIGKLLARARGCTIDGYRIRRECDDAGAALWLCSRNKADDRERVVRQCVVNNDEETE